jgi:hypothetical protein
MVDVLTLLVVLALISGASFAAMVLVVRWQLRRQLRLAPRHRSTAPLLWLAPVTPAARLHRRLRIASASARLSAAVAGPGSPTAQCADELVERAVALEPRLLAAFRPRAATGARRAVERRVAHVEQLARRLATDAVAGSDRPALAGAATDDLTALDERLDALAAARRDLSALERAAGLHPLADH